MAKAAHKREPSALLTVGETCRLLHIHPNTARRWTDEGKLKAYRLGVRQDRRFNPEDVASLLIPIAPVPKQKALKKKRATRSLATETLSSFLPKIALIPYLTPRELSIIPLIAEGNSNKEVANHLGIHLSTVKNHVSDILDKLYANDRAHLVAICFRNGILKVAVRRRVNG